MLGLRRKIRNRKSGCKGAGRQESEAPAALYVPDGSNTVLLHTGNPNTGFASHMSKYIGETVTVFVAGGGMSGSGFTGILLGVETEYIQLLTAIGAAPAYTPVSPCVWLRQYRSIVNGGYRIGTNTAIMYTPGSIANIPVWRVISFIHNTL